jgi:hypothetical protein
MTGPFLSRLRWAAAVAALSAGTAWADPITVTSGRFVISDSGPPFFMFAGADGFVLSAGFPSIGISPQRTCFTGCAPGTVVNLSAVAGGEHAFIPFSLGSAFDSNINGTPFFTFPSPQGRLVGTFRFDAPAVVLPPASEGAARMGASFSAPFVFNGQVTGFGHDDIEGRVPLFELALVGQGTAGLSFDEFSNGLYGVVDERFTFTAPVAPVPEPATLVLLYTGLIAVGAREAHRRKRTQHRPFARPVEFTAAAPADMPAFRDRQSAVGFRRPDL